jgi:hypothetical protein
MDLQCYIMSINYGLCSVTAVLTAKAADLYRNINYGLGRDISQYELQNL